MLHEGEDVCCWLEERVEREVSEGQIQWRKATTDLLVLLPNDRFLLRRRARRPCGLPCSEMLLPQLLEPTAFLVPLELLSFV